MQVYHEPVEVRHLSDPAEFLTAAGPLLLEDEARHNLILGIAGTIRDRPGYYREFHLWVVDRNGVVVAAALQTPPFNLVLARPADEDALAALVDDLAAQDVEFPGLVAALPEVDRFVEAWEQRRAATRRKRRGQRIYRLDRLRPVEGVTGRPRVATSDHRQLLIDWTTAFAEEALGDEPSPASETERVVDGRLRGPASGFLLWEDEDPVSMAGWGGATPSGIRIGPVYTPPDRRGRGYGSAVTAALSRQQLDAGRRFCFLYTDLANPTSNKIYMDIGYEPVCDSVEYTFDPAY
jgi:uncharacterized protein